MWIKVGLSLSSYVHVYMCIISTNEIGRLNLYFARMDQIRLQRVWSHLHIQICHLSLKNSATLPPQAKELESNSDYYLELLSQGTGKPKEEIEKDIQRPKYFRAQEAIDYGIADKIIDSRDDAFEKRVIYLRYL